MSYEHANIRGNKVEKSRVSHITRGYAAGGAVHNAATGQTSLTTSAPKPAQLLMSGGVAKARADRPGRARGGRAPKAKGNNVNVIIAPQGAANSPAGGVGGSPPGIPPVRPMPPPAGPPAGMAGPMGGPGMPPPGMGPRANGGRAYAKGGAVKAAPMPAFVEGKNEGTKVQHMPGKNDLKDMNRGKPITYKTGGAVFAKSTGQHGPKFDGGAGGGTARLEKESRAARNYKKA